MNYFTDGDSYNTCILYLANKLIADQLKFPSNLDRARIESESFGILRPISSFNPVRTRGLLFWLRNEMRIETRRRRRRRRRPTTTTTSAVPDIEDVSHREVERYNHKPVIDLVVLKSEVLRARVPAGYRGRALKFSEPNMHEVLALRMSSLELDEFRRVVDIDKDIGNYSKKEKVTIESAD